MRPVDFKRARAERGAALLLVVVIIAVLVVVGYALLGRSTAENDAIGAKRRYDKSVSCVDAARDYLLSQFRTYGVSPTEIQVSSTVGDMTMRTAHYDDITLKQTVVAEKQYQKGSTSAVNDISNRIVKAGLGGQVYRMTVECASTGAQQQNEVEFLVRFGL